MKAIETVALPKSSINVSDQSDFNFDEIYKNALVSPNEKQIVQEIALIQEIDGQERTMATLGSFSLISGKAKSKKSFLMTLITAISISSFSFAGIRNKLPVGKRNVIYIDTEQSRFYVQKLLNRIRSLSKIDQPDNLSVFELNSYSPTDILQFVEILIAKQKNLGIVIIDGIRDLIFDIMSNEEGNMIARKLLKLSNEWNIHIFVVLHQNKGDTNARGHIGTELVNKCETHLAVSISTEDKDISIVESAASRGRPTETFAFEINNELPVEVENFEIRTSSRKSGFSISNIESHKKFSLLNEIFVNGVEEYSYKDLMYKLKNVFEATFSKSLSDHKARDLINECKGAKWLIQDKSKGPYKQGSYNNSTSE
ncbi:MAG: AAA family ATPase [Aequorivita sp.]|nr:AAA family ATPase [Aequorivita sp.]